MQYPNRVKHLISEGKPAIGTYATMPTSAVVEVAGLAGLDFVIIDYYHQFYNDETLVSMVNTAYSYGLTPWARVRNDPTDIARILDIGVQVITIPNCGTAEEARAAVEATFFAPKGSREASRPLRMRNLSTPDFIEWHNSEILLAVQIEGPEGIKNYQEIIDVEGVDIVQSGRGDMALALGLPGESMHPTVLEVEERIMMAGVEAGKIAVVQEPATAEGIERTNQWIEKGVQVMVSEGDYKLLLDTYRGLLGGLRTGR